jgi:hypothetical protein
MMATRREKVYYELTATDGVSRVFRQAEGSARGLASSYDQIRNAVGLLAGGAFVRSVVNAAVQGEDAQMRLASAIRATGHAVGFTREELDDLADTIARSSRFDDDSVRNAQAQLVKFGNIHGQVFERALESSADLAAFMGTDITSAVQQVGRALQSPTEGVQTLEGLIGKLTDAEEAHIRKLAESGQAVEAQEAVLKFLQDRIGGTAEGMNQGLGGAIAGVTNAWDDFLEALGRTPAVSGKTGGFLGFLEQSLKDLQEIIQHGDWVEKTLALAAFAGGWRGFSLSRDADAEALRRAQEDQERLEAGLRPAPRVVLGGATGGRGKSEAQKAAEARAKLEAEILKSDVASIIAAETKAYAQFGEVLDQFSIDALKAEQAWTKFQDGLHERDGADMVRDEAAAWADLQKIIDGTSEVYESIGDTQRSLAEAGEQLGFTFASAFEDAIIEGERLRDVLDSLAKDIARIILRKTVTEPMANAIAKWALGLSDVSGSFNPAAIFLSAPRAGR